jgi:hypothetical protein
MSTAAASFIQGAFPSLQGPQCPTVGPWHGACYLHPAPSSTPTSIGKLWTLHYETSLPAVRHLSSSTWCLSNTRCLLSAPLSFPHPLPHPQAPLSSRERLALSPVCPGRASCLLMRDRSTSVLLYCPTSPRQYRGTAWVTVLPPAHKTAAAWCSTPLGPLAAAGHATLQLCPGTPQVCDVV